MRTAKIVSTGCLCTICMLMLIFPCGIVSAAITNLNTVSSMNALYIEWDNGSVEKTIGLENDTILYTATAPTIDGVLEPYYEGVSCQYNIYSPNPTFVNQLDNVWMLYDTNYVYVGLLAHDADNVTNDEALRLYIDVDNDGLDTVQDVMYEFNEVGTVNRYKWNGGSWANSPGTGATLAITGAGTNEYQMEARVPKAEITGIGFANGYQTQTMLRRTHKIPPDLFRYYPHLQNGLLVNDVNTWANIRFVPAGGNPFTTVGTTTENEFNITGLGSFNWYRINVSETLTPSSFAITEAVTTNELQYQVTGAVYNSATGEPIYNTRVHAVYKGDTVREDYTNITGQFVLSGLFNRSYEIHASKDGVESIIGVDMRNGDIQELEFYLEPVPADVEVERATSEVWILYVLILAMFGFLFFSLWLMLGDGANVASIFTMTIAALAAFKISNLWIDGTLTHTVKLMSPDGTIVSTTDVIRNTAMSSIFEYIGIGLAILILLQLYMFIKGSKKETEGDDYY